jgi:hypothetical protein
MNFTDKNHLSYSIGDRKYGFRESVIDKFTVEVGKIDPQHYAKTNFETELQRTADLVYREFGNDFILLLSGGTDSEIVAHNFLSIGIKPYCVTARFVGDYNLTDVEEAKRITKELDLKHDIIDFDIREFYYSGQASEFGSGIQCTQITYNMCYFLLNRLQSAGVMGGEALLTRNVTKNDSYWYWTFRENEDASAMRFAIKYNLPLVNEWFSYTPELLLCYLEDTEIVKLVTEKYNYKLTSVSSKNRILKRLCPYVTEKRKTHGFENLLAFNHQSYRDTASLVLPRLEPSLDGIKYEEVIQQLRGIE